jgi:enoyl-CoA hydratase/carnithine racemase
MADLEVRREDGVGTILLNRPERRNAFTHAMIGAWIAALEELQADDAVGAIVVRGAGADFCAGADLGGDFADMGTTPLAQKEALRLHVQRIPLLLEAIDKPVLAALSGVAYGAGLDLALLCDLRVAGRSARLCESYIRVGLMPGAGAAYLLPRLVGLPKALELLLLGEPIDGTEAHRIGLVNRVVEDADVVAETEAMARRLAAGPPLATRMLKRLVRQSATADLRTALELASSQMAVIRTTKDSVEALEAFAERRPAHYTGR